MTESRPRNVTIASGLLIVDALFGALSVNVLAHFSGRTEHVLQFHALVWVPALLQIIAAVLLMRRCSWVRYAVAAVVLLLVIDSALNTSWPQAYASSPGATLRDALFAGLLALVPVAATSLFLRLRRIDRRFHDEVTGGWHTAAYIVFVGGSAVFVNLHRSMRRIAANVMYPSGLRRFAKALCVYQVVAFIGLLACAALLMIQRAMV